MTLIELKTIIDKTLELSPLAATCKVAIPNNTPGMMGGTPCTYVRFASRGIDWDHRVFFIYPEVAMINQTNKEKQ